MVALSTSTGFIGTRQVLGLTRRQEVNGEHYIDITTTRELEKGDLVYVTSDVDGITREYTVWSGSEPHSQDLIARTYRCVWSLQGILSGVTSSTMPSNKTARQALESLLTDTDAFAIGTVEPTTTASASFWRMSAWEGLAELVKNWGGEVTCDYANGTRTVNLLNRIGQDGAFTFYWGSSEIESIERKTADGPEVCRIIPLGAATETDAGGYGRKVDITSVNGGIPYLEDSQKASEMAGDPQPTATLYVENPEITEPADLKAWGLGIIEKYTRPAPEYDVRLVERYARAGGYVPALGDSGAIIDSEMGISLQARVYAITVDELAQSVKAELSTAQTVEGALAQLVSASQTLGGVNSNGIVAAAGFSVVDGGTGYPVWHEGNMPSTPKTNLPLSSECEVYTTARTPFYVRSGGMVNLCGAVKPKSEIAAQGTMLIGTLPQGCRPIDEIQEVMQGSGTCIWNIQLLSDGTVTMRRYRNEVGYRACPTSAWLPFNITFAHA